jgi:hypothetical protein
MALALGLDERTLRGANVWIKPMKFASSLAVMAWTTAWFVGHLDAAHRRSRAVSWIVWPLIGAGAFEVGYITFQAALGQGSHYVVHDLFHGVMYTLMGIGATVLTATQAMLAWQLHRHADPRRRGAYRLAVKLGLVLTFVLGTTVGFMLGGRQPPDVVAGLSLPITGWSLAGGDLRPAHFVGIHAEQVLPIIGFVAATFLTRHARRWVWVSTVGWIAVFLVALAWGLR